MQRLRNVSFLSRHSTDQWGVFYMTIIQQAAQRVAGFSIVAMALATPAFAGFPVPGPVLGAGIPALVAIGAGYWLIRKRRQR